MFCGETVEIEDMCVGKGEVGIFGKIKVRITCGGLNIALKMFAFL